MTDDKKIAFWLILIVGFFAFRIVSINWIEPYLKRFDSPGWLDRKTSLHTVQGNIGNIIFCLLMLTVLWGAEGLLHHVYAFFGGHYHYDPKKVTWIRASLTPIFLLLVFNSLLRIKELKK